MKLIDNIHQFFSFLSVKATIFGATVATAIAANPDAASAAIGSVVPPQYMPFVGIVVWAATSLAGRAIKQPSLQPKDLVGDHDQT